jgi:hypothetical protein
MRTQPIITNFNAFWDTTNFDDDNSTDGAIGFDVKNARDPRRYTAWKNGLFPSGGAELILEYNAGSSVSPAFTAWGLAQHNCSGRLVGLYGSTNGSTWVLLDSYTPPNNEAFLKILGTSSTYKYHSIKFEDYFEARIGVPFVGRHLVFERYSEEGFDPKGRDFDIKSSMSRTGELLGRVLVHKENNLSLTFNYLGETFMEALGVDWWDVYGFFPFFLLWDPTDHPLECLYAALDPDAGLDAPRGPAALRVTTFDIRGDV